MSTSNTIGRSVDIEVNIEGEDSTTNTIMSEDYDSTTKDRELARYLDERFRESTLKGDWEEVKKLYKSDVKFSIMKINKSIGTALHVAVNEGNESVVSSLVGSILHHKNTKALEEKNEKGDTPLHLAASRGFKEMCKCIIGENGERKDLIYIDLAIIVIDKFPYLGEIPNKEGYTPLKLLATRPSAFKSGCNMIWWKKILYHCIFVENLNIKKAVKSHGKKQDQVLENSCPKNYVTCYAFLQKCQDAYDNKEKDQKILMSSHNEEKRKHLFLDQQHMDISKPLDRELLPENYDTFLGFLKFACIYIFGLSGVGVDEVRKMKQKHKWCNQLLNIFMSKITYSSIGTGTEPLQNESEIDTSRIDFPKPYIPNQALESEDAKKFTTLETEKAKKKAKILKSETPILTAARYDIVEMVNVLMNEIPSSIYETNLENKNILLVAIENRRVIVVELLKKWFLECNENQIFDNLIQWVDNEDNTVLHLAAKQSYQDWNTSGAALEMMWHIKWFQYTKGLVPTHFTIRTNKMNQTAEEMFKKSYAPQVEEGSKWLKETSQSCSVVAALLAGVSFATSSTVPGGNKSDTGEPTLEGKPAFDAFALSSAIGLCFSVTALIMFLSILTSRKKVKDFRINLPWKLLYGLSSLFFSIVAMFTAFCSGNFFLIDKKYKHIEFLIYQSFS